MENIEKIQGKQFFTISLTDYVLTLILYITLSIVTIIGTIYLPKYNYVWDGKKSELVNTTNSKVLDEFGKF